MTQPKTISELRENLADIEHQRWSHWQQYVHKNVYDSSQSINPHLKVIPTELYNRWERQINTPYSELTEQEKESDRKEVDKYLPVILSHLASEVEKLLKNNSDYNKGVQDAVNIINNLKK